MKIQRPYARRIVTKRPELNKRCLEKLEKQIEHLNLRKRVEGIKNNVKNLSLQQVASQLNFINQLKAQEIATAERKFRKLHMGEVPLFPGLATKAITVIFWKMMYRRKL